MKKAYSVTGIVLILIIGAFFILRGEGDIIESTNIMAELSLTSSAFSVGESIPTVYTCDGDNTSPPLEISGVSDNAKSLVLIMDDPDIPEVVKTSRGIEKFDHWVLFNLPTNTTALAPNYSGEGVLGINSAGEAKYTGPCPPTEYEPTQHRYIFQLYELDTELDLTSKATQEEVRNAMGGHILQKVELMGLYDRNN